MNVSDCVIAKSVNLGELWNRLSAKIRKHEDIEDLETGTIDISGHWQPFLDIWFELVCALKVPHKSKRYDQMFFRTMFFPREDTVTIDGVTHEILNAIKVDTWNSKCMIVNDVFEAFRSVDDMEEETFLDLKKKLINQLKTFDKQYVKHIKKTHPDVNSIVSDAITPLLELLESNYNFHKIEELMKKKHEIPSFRFKALEDKFCEHLEVICQTLKDHGDLKQTFAIKRMLNLLKLDNWEENVPMAFYLTPLRNSIKTMRDELIAMRKRGPNRCKYYIEQNEPMQAYVIDMVAKDVTAQWLMGDKLKNDQLCFLYDVVKIIYMSPLRYKLINTDKEVTDTVIPQLATFKALLIIREILQIKIDDKKKQKDLGKLALDVIKRKREKELEELEENKDLKDVEDEKDEEIRQFKLKKKLEEEEIKRYGRQWIWEKYISDSRKDEWVETAETLRHVNEHVINDIQDYILIRGFKRQQQQNRKTIDEKVESLLVMNVEEKIKEDKKAIDEVKNKRKFEMSLRPPFVWNFFETRTDREEKIKIQQEKDHQNNEEQQEEEKENQPYLINAFAQPQSCYQFEETIKENRVSKVIKSIEALAANLRSHEVEKWKTLTQLCIAIFKDMSKKDKNNENAK